MLRINAIFSVSLSLALFTSLSLVVFVFYIFFARFGFIFYCFFWGFCLACFNLLQLFCAIRLLLWIVKANRHEIVLFAFRLFFPQSLLRRRRLTSSLNGSYSTFPFLPLFYVFFRFCSIVELKVAWNLGGEKERERERDTIVCLPFLGWEIKSIM